MSIIHRKNDSSHFLIQKEDTKERDKGIYLVETRTSEKTGKEKTTYTYISTVIYIAEKVRSESANYYKVIYHDSDEIRFRYVKGSNLFNDGAKDSEDLKYIIDNGLLISHKCKPLVIDFLKCMSETVPIIEGTEKTGWNENGDYIACGLNTSDNVVYTGNSIYQFTSKGDKEDYKKKIYRLFKENPLVFAVCSYAGSAFLLKHLSNEINQVLALNGTTSKGKSTAGKLALSLFTNPKYFFGMGGTKIGMGELIKAGNDNFIFFDEVGESNMLPREREEFIYQLANGTERNRSRKNRFTEEFGATRQEEKYKYTVLLAGEKSFFQGVRPQGTGLDARFLEIVLPPNVRLWEKLTKTEEAEELNEYIHNHYGLIAEDYVNAIKREKHNIPVFYADQLKQIRKELNTDDAVIKRKARILAYTKTAAHLLSYCILPEGGNSDELNEVVDLAIEKFKNALFANTSADNPDLYKEALSHIELNLDRYIYDEAEEHQSIIETWGFVKRNAIYKEVSIISNRFTEACVKLNLDEKLFISYLRDNDLLQRDAERNTKKIMINGARSSYYVIRVPHEFFEQEEERQADMFNQEDEDDDIIPF